jgi:hypothetical protein
MQNIFLINEIIQSRLLTNECHLIQQLQHDVKNWNQIINLQIHPNQIIILNIYILTKIIKKG